MCQCNKVQCGCVKTISKTGKAGKNGQKGKDGKDGLNGVGIDITFRPTVAQVRNGSSVPVIVIPAPGAGKAISVIHSTARRKYNTTAYTSAGVILSSYPTSAGQTGTTATFLTSAPIGGADATMVNMSRLDNTIRNVGENLPLYFLVGSADSIVGDDEIVIYITYKIITI